MRLFVAFLLLLVGSCTHTPLTEDEREEKFYSEALEYEKWFVCQSAMKRHGVIVVHDGHSMKQDRQGSHTIREDLMRWHLACNRLWKEYGYE